MWTRDNSLSTSWDRIGTMKISRKLIGAIGVSIFATGVIMEVCHWLGTWELEIESLMILARASEYTGGIES